MGEGVWFGSALQCRQLLSFAVHRVTEIAADNHRKRELSSVCMYNTFLGRGGKRLKAARCKAATRRVEIGEIGLSQPKQFVDTKAADLRRLVIYAGDFGSSP